MPDFSLVGQADLRTILTLSAVPLLLSVIMVDFFDTLGMVTTITDQAGLVNEDGRIPKLRRILGVAKRV